MFRPWQLNRHNALILAASRSASISRFRIAMIFGQGIRGRTFLDSSEIRLAASPMISISLTSASTSMRSRLKSSLLRRAMKDTASLAASSMCLSRMTSASFILDGGCRNHLVAEISAEVPGSPQVDLAAQLFRQFQFHAGDVEKSGLTPRLELHQNVDVAFGPKARGQDGTEKRQLANVIPPTDSDENKRSRSCWPVYPVVGWR